tara:strand:- start:801 stop:1145 length:345 start_codon:yes stop_codon:yes gene_type:complete
MIKYVLTIFLSFLFLIFDTAAYSSDFSTKAIEKYTLKISTKFSNTYCNSIKFGISKDGALRFSIGETNKEFSNNELNKFIDYELLNRNILLSLENDCNIFDFPEYELKNLAFKY